MIHDALRLIREELQDYINANQESGEPATEVVLRNIGMLDSDSADLDDRLVITLVNIEEERTLKNIPSFQKNNNSNTVTYQNAPVHLNLYVLFSANFVSGSEPYEMALLRLSHVIRFFQMKNVFTIQTSTDNAFLNSVFDPGRNQIKIILNLYSMTFEQLNHLWGSLGGKQVPSAMYRCWLVELQDDKLSKSGALIEEIKSQEKIN
ncbi:MAG: DUF4255 domain-containing protein [Saprospiraceae bacterium]